MKTLFFFAVLMLISVSATEAAGKKWALLIAGSNHYINYRHQSDVCHAYQVLHKNGIPDEQIVVMMYDDIAHNPNNPFPGNIINRPNGPNVYPGVPKDYTNKDVNGETFLAVLQGNKSEVRRLTGRSGKVIDSGPEDHVFVYFSDHGGPGLIAMPNGGLLLGRKIIAALKNMHQRKRYGKLVFYLEACESGSIFHKVLPSDINVYATTAASPSESSWAYYCKGQRDTCLGDEYSIHWLEDTESHNVHKETFGVQYERVKNLTKQSHVQHYGDLTFSSDVLSDFMAGNKSQQQEQSIDREEPTTVQDVDADAIPSEMVPMVILQRRIAKAPEDSKMRFELEAELKYLELTRDITHQVFRDIAATSLRPMAIEDIEKKFLTHHEDIDNWDCYENAVETLVNTCPGLKTASNDFALRKLFILVNLCNNIPSRNVVLGIQEVADANSFCRN